MQYNNISDTGLTVSTLGFGAATIGNLYRPLTNEIAIESVHAAIDEKINYFDTAPFYGFGLSERRLGDALRGKGSQKCILSTKVGRLLKKGVAKPKYGFDSPMPFEPYFDYSYDGVMRSYEQSLQRIGLAKIDILYMHDIGRMGHGKQHNKMFKIALEGGYKAMHELREQGEIKAIGLGVNETEICEQFMEHCELDCLLLAGRYTLLEQKALISLFPKCLASNTSIILGGPYNSGILATGTSGTKTPFYDYAPASNGIISKVKQIEKACAEYQVKLTAAALQFPLAHPSVVSVIPGLSSSNRVKQTADDMRSKIPSEFWSELKRKNLINQDAPTP